MDTKLTLKTILSAVLLWCLWLPVIGAQTRTYISDPNGQGIAKVTSNRLWVDIGTNLTLNATNSINTSTNIDANIARVKGTATAATNGVLTVFDLGRTLTNAQFGSFLKVCSGDTNVPVQLSATTLNVRTLSLVGFSNRLANVGIVWVQMTNAANDVAIPLLSAGMVSYSAPPGTLLDLANVYLHHEVTNDSVGAIWSR